MTFPLLALILVGIFVPESPLWLVEKGFYDLADNVIHFLGRDEDEFAGEVKLFFIIIFGSGKNKIMPCSPCAKGF